MAKKARSARSGSAPRRGRRRSTSPSLVPLARWHKELVGRLGEAAGGSTFDEIGRVTKANHETVRRYMKHGRTSSEFLRAFCLAYKVEPKWLLLGKGPMKAK